MSSVSFTEECEKLETDQVKQVATHRLFREMATGELELSRFTRLIQQDHLYLKSDYPNNAIMADKEVDPGRKEILNKWSIPGSSMALIESYFPQFEIKAVPKPEKFTEEYIKFKRDAALNDSVAVSLSTHYACWILWNKAGIEMDKIAKYENNKYSRFLQGVANKDITSIEKRKLVLNGYYERASEAEKKKMLENYKKAVGMELKFCNGVYNEM